jgi:selenoprotein W-related protein
VPSSGGAFEVAVDGDLVFSKKATGRHAEHDVILELIRERYLR